MISRLSEGLSRNTFSVSVMLLLFRLNFYPQIKKRDSQEKSPAFKMKKYLGQSLLLSFFLFLSAFLFPAKTCIFHAFLVLVGDFGALFLV